MQWYFAQCGCKPKSDQNLASIQNFLNSTITQQPRPIFLSSSTKKLSGPSLYTWTLNVPFLSPCEKGIQKVYEHINLKKTFNRERNSSLSYLSHSVPTTIQEGNFVQKNQLIALGYLVISQKMFLQPSEVMNLTSKVSL